MQEDHLSFLFRANRSLDPLPLAMIASGILMGVAAVRNLKPDRKFAEEISAAPLVIRGAMSRTCQRSIPPYRSSLLTAFFPAYPEEFCFLIALHIASGYDSGSEDGTNDTALFGLSTQVRDNPDTLNSTMD